MKRVLRDLAAGIIGMSRWPHVALRGADLVAPLTGRFRRVPSADEIRELFPDLSADVAHALAKHVLRSFVRTEFLALWLRPRGRAGARTLLVTPEPPQLPPGPVIAGTFHMGPVHTLGAALESLPAPLLGLRNPTPEPMGVHERAAKFYEAATWLRKGGIVLMALDPQHASRIHVPFFNGTLGLARGAFALSRRTGAPIVPVIARWRGTRAEALAGQPLEGRDEHELAAAAARWLEQHLRAHPDELSLRILDLMQR